MTYAVTFLKEEREAADNLEDISRECHKEEHRQPGDILNDMWKGFDVEESETAKHNMGGEGNEKSEPILNVVGNEKMKHHVGGEGNKENEADCVIRTGKDQEKKKLRFKLPEEDLQQDVRRGKNY